MPILKDALCLLAILFAYGIAGHMDYEDAVMLEQAQRPQRSPAPVDCWSTTTSTTGHFSARIRRPETVPHHRDLSDPALGPSSEATEPCPPVIF